MVSIYVSPFSQTLCFRSCPPTHSLHGLHIPHGEKKSSPWDYITTGAMQFCPLSFPFYLLCTERWNEGGQMTASYFLWCKPSVSQRMYLKTAKVNILNLAQGSLCGTDASLPLGLIFIQYPGICSLSLLCCQRLQATSTSLNQNINSSV